MTVLDNGRLVTGGDDGTIRVWRRNGEVSVVMAGHSGAVLSLVTLPTGEIASGGADKTIKTWANGQCLATLQGHVRIAHFFFCRLFPICFCSVALFVFFLSELLELTKRAQRSSSSK